MVPRVESDILAICSAAEKVEALKHEQQNSDHDPASERQSPLDEDSLLPRVLTPGQTLPGTCFKTLIDRERPKYFDEDYHRRGKNVHSSPPRTVLTARDENRWRRASRIVERYSYASFKTTDLTRIFASNPPSLLHTTYEMATKQPNKHTDTLTRQEVINYRYMKGLKPPQIKEKTGVFTPTIRRILRSGNAKSNYQP